MKKLSVITRCTRLQHLPTIQKSVFSNSKEGYIYYLDDDNILHPDFIETVSQETCKSQIYTFDQFVDGKDFTRLEYRIASPENTKYQGIDLAQLLFHHSV